jgi:hypothetical protein
LAKLIIFFAFISIVNAIVIRITIKCSIFLLLWYIKVEEQCRRNSRRENIRTRYVYSLIGSAGAEAAYLERNGMSTSCIILGLLSAMVIYYAMFIACNTIWTSMSIPSVYSGIVNEEYFFYVNIIELLSFIFVRTRSSIKYLPKMLTVFNLTYLMYVNSYMYAAQE